MKEHDFIQIFDSFVVMLEQGKITLDFNSHTVECKLLEHYSYSLPISDH